MDEEHEYDPEREALLNQINDSLPTIFHKLLTADATELIQDCWQSPLLKDAVERQIEKSRKRRIIDGSKRANN